MSWMMVRIVTFFIIFWVSMPFSVSSEEVVNREQLEKNVQEINSYSELIEQIKSEKGQAKGLEARVLAKSLIKKQADMLSGLIRFDKDKLAVLEKKLSFVPSDSKRLPVTTFFHKSQRPTAENCPYIHLFT